MQLIFLYGFPGVGKLTVARELAKSIGFRVFHNHLTVDLLLSVFEFGSPSFIRLRDEIWITTMIEAAKSGSKGLIFTFAPEDTVPVDFIERLQNQMKKVDSKILFVKFQCSEFDLKQRMIDPSRNDFHKLKNFEFFEKQRRLGNYNSPACPGSAVIIDTSKMAPSQVAEKIREELVGL